MNNRNQKKIKKRKTIAIETKIAILNRLADGEGSTALSKEFKLGESTIRSIQKRANKINKSNNCATNESGKRASYSRNIVIEKTEEALIFWIKDSSRKRIGRNLIKKKAKQFFNLLKDLEPSSSSSQLNNLQFSASNGWLSGFLRRHALHNVKMQGKASPAGETAAKNYCKVLDKIIDDGGYCPDQVSNADDTGLFWKEMPGRTFIVKTEKTVSGFRAANDRITFLFCSNVSGARILKPPNINQALHPRALKYINLAELPVHFMINKKVWVTSAVFTIWFNDCFVPKVEKYMTEEGLPFKVLLIVDNAPGNPCLDNPNVQVVFLPPNTTSLLQPLDQGIIATFNKNYMKLTVSYILEKLKTDGISLIEVWKKFSTLDCINHATAAISSIKQHTLHSSWKPVWPECVSNRAVTENTCTLSSEIIALAHNICGESFDTFSENNLIEITKDETVNDSDIINNSTDLEDGQEEPDSMTADTVYAGIQLCSKLEKHFLKIDNNSERSLKFQKELQSCISGYCDVYKQLIKQPSSQKLITDYMVRKIHKSTLKSSSGESDFEPVYHKNMRVLGYDE